MQRALERQTLYADLATQMQRQGLLLGHEIMGSTTQSQVFDRDSRPGHWRKPSVKPILHKLEVGVAETLPLLIVCGWKEVRKGVHGSKPESTHGTLSLL